MEDDALPDDDSMEVEPAAPPTGPAAPNSWLSLILALAALTLGAVMATILVRQYLSARPLDLKGHSLEVSRALTELLVSNRVVPTIADRVLQQTRGKNAAHWYFSRYSARLPASLDAKGIEAVVEKEMRRRGVAVRTLEEGGAELGLILAFGDHVFAEVEFLAPPLQQTVHAVESRSNSPIDAASVPDPRSPSDEPAPQYPAPETGRGSVPPAPRSVPAASNMQRPARLAIIIDDGGYGGEVTDDILSLSPGLTLAILPYTPFARKIATRANELGFEVLLHMPMQSLSERARFDGQLDTDMSEDEIRQLTEQALAEVPFAVGANNHTGSRFTAYAEGMSIFLDGLAERGLFFIDSRTSDLTKGERLARAAGVATASRDLFLDNELERDAILARLSEAANLAIKNGKVVAICHFQAATAHALAEFLPTLEQDGIELVHASELVH